MEAKTRTNRKIKYEGNKKKSRKTSRISKQKG